MFRGKNALHHEPVIAWAETRGNVAPLFGLIKNVELRWTKKALLQKKDKPENYACDLIDYVL